MRKKLFGLLVIAAVLAGVFLPGTAVQLQERAAVGEAQQVPEKYESAASAAASKSASASLTVHEKLQLVTGKWESTTKEASCESSMSGYEAQKLARTGVEKLCGAELYPQRISSDYGDWYNWKVSTYKAVDTTFRTYAAYYWRVTFEKYDGSARHEIWLLEDGTIFFARVTADALDCSALQTTESRLSQEGQGSYTWEAYKGGDALSLLDYTGADLSGLTVQSALSVADTKTDRDAVYCVIQAKGGDEYLWAVVPR